MCGKFYNKINYKKCIVDRERRKESEIRKFVRSLGWLWLEVQPNRDGDDCENKSVKGNKLVLNLILVYNSENNNNKNTRNVQKKIVGIFSAAFFSLLLLLLIILLMLRRKSNQSTILACPFFGRISFLINVNS
jgi:hypothetical protein